MAEVDLPLKFGKMQEFWQKKSAQQGDRYVGHIKENHNIQQKQIESLLRERLKPEDYFESSLDFGCGWGRFVPFFSQFCGHVWATDLLKAMVDKAALKAPNVTAIQSKWPLKMPGRGRRFDLLWASLVFQHIVDDEVFDATIVEIGRVLKPGARVLILDNIVDKAHHVKPRGVKKLAEALRLQPGYYSSNVTINQRPNDHCLIDGIKA